VGPMHITSWWGEQFLSICGLEWLSSLAKDLRALIIDKQPVSWPVSQFPHDAQPPEQGYPICCRRERHPDALAHVQKKKNIPRKRIRPLNHSRPPHSAPFQPTPAKDVILPKPLLRLAWVSLSELEWGNPKAFLIRGSQIVVGRMTQRVLSGRTRSRLDTGSDVLKKAATLTRTLADRRQG